MYQVSLYNNGVETMIHAPIPEKEAPHLLGISLSDVLNRPQSISISMSIDNPGYSIITEFVSKIKIYDTRDNTVVFNGRVLNISESMGSQGLFKKDILCEGALAYLNDSHVRLVGYTNKTPTQIIDDLLNTYNSTHPNARIERGTINFTQPLTIDYHYETVLNCILKLRNILGGDVRVRETAGVLYLDYLTDQGSNNGVQLKLGYNQKSLVKEYDPSDLVTRIVALGYGDGINQLTIKDVNGGIDYVEDSAAKVKYGVIEGIVTDIDIQNPETLKQKALTVLGEKKQPKLTIEADMIDLSVLTGHENEKFFLGDTIQIVNPVMNVDVLARVVDKQTDLFKPWNPKIVISTRPITLTDQILDLKQRSMSLENAPQGNTCIYSQREAENADPLHPIIFDVDIPDEAININRVYINLHGRKYRTDSKELAGGGSYSKSQTTSTSNYPTSKTDLAIMSGTAEPWEASHIHPVSIVVGDHKHVVTIPAISIPEHTHPIVYGIVESTYPKQVEVWVNGTFVTGSFGDGSEPIDLYNIDITAYISKGNNKVELRTTQNGRIEAAVYTQIFIQSK